jgi:hypothetical protein
MKMWHQRIKFRVMFIRDGRNNNAYFEDEYTATQFKEVTCKGLKATIKVWSDNEWKIW